MHGHSTYCRPTYVTSLSLRSLPGDRPSNWRCPSCSHCPAVSPSWWTPTPPSDCRATRWRAIRIRHTWYAARDDGEKLVYMHREILRAPDGLMVGHRDGNGLNNSRANLRLVTARENAINTIKRPGCSSRYRGVDWCKSARAWRARVWVDGRETLVGYYATEEEAARAREQAAQAIYGEYVTRRCYALG